MHPFIQQKIQEKCKEGFILPEDLELIIKIANDEGIKERDVRDAVENEIAKIKASHNEALYELIAQPEAAVFEDIVFAENNRRAYPEMLYLGCLESVLDNKTRVPAFAGIGCEPFVTNNAKQEIEVNNLTYNNSGLCFIYDKLEAEKVHNYLLKQVFRMLLSLPEGGAEVILVDCNNFGEDFVTLAGMKRDIFTTKIDDTAQLQTKINEWKKYATSIGFDVFKGKYKTLVEYNQANPKSAKHFKLVLISNFAQGLTPEITAELIKLTESGSKAGIYFFIAGTHVQMGSWADTLSNNLLAITENNEHYFLTNTGNDEVYNKSFCFIPELEIFEGDKWLKWVNEGPGEPEKPIEFWKGDINKFSIKLGKDGDDKTLEISLNNRNGIVLVGEIGTGKTNEIIKILEDATWLYSPEHLKIISLSTSEASIFKTTHHTQLIAPEADNRYVYSVLEYIDAEINRRKTIFSAQKAADFEQYNGKQPDVIPRVLVTIDHFEIFASETDLVLRTNGLSLLEGVMSKCGKYGIHILVAGSGFDSLQKVFGQCGQILLFKTAVSPALTNALQFSSDIAKLDAFEAIWAENIQGKENFYGIKTEKADTALIKSNIKEFEKATQALSYTHNGLYLAEGEVYQLPAGLLENAKANSAEAHAYIGIAGRYEENFQTFITFSKVANSNLLIAGSDKDAAIALCCNTLSQLIKQSAADSDFFVFNLNDALVAGQLKALAVNSATNKLRIYNSPDRLSEVLDELIEEMANLGSIAGGKMQTNVESRKVLVIAGLTNDGALDDSVKLKIETFLNQGAPQGSHLIFITESKPVFENVLGFSAIYSFNNRIALKGGEDIISPMAFIGNTVAKPQKPNEAILETNDGTIKPVYIYQL